MIRRACRSSSDWILWFAICCWIGVNGADLFSELPQGSPSLLSSEEMDYDDGDERVGMASFLIPLRLHESLNKAAEADGDAESDAVQPVTSRPNFRSIENFFQALADESSTDHKTRNPNFRPIDAIFQALGNGTAFSFDNLESNSTATLVKSVIDKLSPPSTEGAEILVDDPETPEDTSRSPTDLMMDAVASVLLDAPEAVQKLVRLHGNKDGIMNQSLSIMSNYSQLIEHLMANPEEVNPSTNDDVTTPSYADSPVDVNTPFNEDNSSVPSKKDITADVDTPSNEDSTPDVNSASNKDLPDDVTDNDEDLAEEEDSSAATRSRRGARSGSRRRHRHSGSGGCTFSQNRHRWYPLTHHNRVRPDPTPAPTPAPAPFLQDSAHFEALSDVIDSSEVKIEALPVDVEYQGPSEDPVAGSAEDVAVPNTQAPGGGGSYGYNVNLLGPGIEDPYVHAFIPVRTSTAAPFQEDPSTLPSAAVPEVLSTVPSLIEASSPKPPKRRPFFSRWF